MSTLSSTTAPRPKPWETSAPLNEQQRNALPLEAVMASTQQNSSQSENNNNSNSNSNSNNSNISSESPPEVLPRPTALNSSSTYGDVNTMPAAYSNSSYGMPYDNNAYGMNSMYGNSIGRYGYGGSYYGNNYGSFYGGGYGAGAGAGAGYGMNNGNGLGESTKATFQLIESLIGAVTGFAQMLESTYMATHNSFFTMVSVAEQFGNLREMLGSFFGIFAIMKFLKKVLYHATKGRLGTPPKKVTSTEEHKNKLVEDFQKFNGNDIVASNGKATRRKISWKPLLFFLMAVFGFPYLLNKFITKVQNSGAIQISKGSGSEPIDPSKLEFARALYDFVPENPQIEVALTKGDLMAILSKKDPIGKNSDWWKVRTKNGKIGYIPYNYIEIIKRRKKIEHINEKVSAH
ncbi:hypothetical protein SKDZ_12G2270 [Saccharomyces kudriavzevii ZP591]|uniref:Peroxisomal membrane protein PEX13 n=1 Tax=Saccharomyces cerevisiae x Saccharomyces kudriavzevii (strain VIN7) TaxID=1095631 RepID=H0GYC3_SACCK|nr:Pex13p [Saccharomyces cerevisiae x Saccharomyces kudriavzevii VIN7]CAI4046363.1 hypothetical protein SKDZ_12G2270 [Saccharomyces kudriavzevii ZP591]